jgi:hypothetical protein
MIYIVLGTPRSGTSMVAGVLAKLGLPMGLEGNEHLCEGNEWNQDGFYTDPQLVAIMDAFHPHADHKMAGSLKNMAPQMLTNYMAAMEKKYTHFGMKEHRLPLEPVWSTLMAVAQTPIALIVTSRSFDKSVASWAERRRCTLEEAEAYLSQHVQGIKNIVAGWKGNILTVSYLAALDDKEFFVKSIADYIHMPVTQEAIDSIKPELKRF